MTEGMTSERMYTARELADWLRCDPDVIYDLVARGEIGHIRVSRKVLRFPESDVQEYIAKRNQRSSFIKRIVPTEERGQATQPDPADRE